MQNTEDMKDDAEKQYRRLKLSLEEVQNRKKGKYPIIGGTIIAILFFTTSLLIVNKFSYKIDIWDIIIWFIAGIGFGAAFFLYTIMYYEMKESSIRQNMLEYEAEDVKDEVKEDIFENSIKMSYKYLDQYYLQTREQAQRGFFVTVCVAILGAILIGVGVATMFLGQTEPSYVTCGAGVITEFIAAVFFYLYNRTVSSMSKYHNKLVISQNISIALKVSESLPSDDKAKAKNKIIDELLKDVNTHLVKSDADN